MAWQTTALAEAWQASVDAAFRAGD